MRKFWMMTTIHQCIAVCILKDTIVYFAKNYFLLEENFKVILLLECSRKKLTKADESSVK